MPQKIEHTHPQTLNIILINTNPPCCKIWTLKTPPLQILYFLSCSNQNITHTTPKYIHKLKNELWIQPI